MAPRAGSAMRVPHIDPLRAMCAEGQGHSSALAHGAGAEARCGSACTFAHGTLARCRVAPIGGERQMRVPHIDPLRAMCAEGQGRSLTPSRPSSISAQSGGDRCHPSAIRLKWRCASAQQRNAAVISSPDALRPLPVRPSRPRRGPALPGVRAGGTSHDEIPPAKATGKRLHRCIRRRYVWRRRHLLVVLVHICFRRRIVVSSLRSHHRARSVVDRGSRRGKDSRAKTRAHPAHSHRVADDLLRTASPTLCRVRGRRDARLVGVGPRHGHRGLRRDRVFDLAMPSRGSGSDERE